ncbi:MAG: hypothetical protein IPO40_18710 [Fibrobacteres bacterium]|nr:hypothetical protein [Fibrobacterota bacterium]
MATANGVMSHRFVKIMKVVGVAFIAILFVGQIIVVFLSNLVAGMMKYSKAEDFDKFSACFSATTSFVSIFVALFVIIIQVDQLMDARRNYKEEVERGNAREEESRKQIIEERRLYNLKLDEERNRHIELVTFDREKSRLDKASREKSEILAMYKSLEYQTSSISFKDAFKGMTAIGLAQAQIIQRLNRRDSVINDILYLEEDRELKKFILSYNTVLGFAIFQLIQHRHYELEARVFLCELLKTSQHHELEDMNVFVAHKLSAYKVNDDMDGYYAEIEKKVGEYLTVKAEFLNELNSL